MDGSWSTVRVAAEALESPLALSRSQTLILIYVEEAQGHDNDSSFEEEACVREMTCGETWRLGVLVYVYTCDPLQQGYLIERV